MSGQILQYVINYQLVKSEPAVCVLRISTARFSRYQASLRIMTINTGRPTGKSVKEFHPVSLGLSSVFLQTTCRLPEGSAGIQPP